MYYKALPVEFLGQSLTPSNTATRGYTLGDLPIEFFIEENSYAAIVTTKENVLCSTSFFVGYHRDEISLLATLMKHCDGLDKYFYKYMFLI